MNSTTSKRAYRDPGEITRVLRQHQNLDSERDWSQEILMLLALAIDAANRLKEVHGATMELQGRPLVIPSIERAFRETLHVRINLPPEAFKAGTNWPIVLSRFGEIEEKD